MVKWNVKLKYRENNTVRESTLWTHRTKHSYFCYKQIKPKTNIESTLKINNMRSLWW